MNRAPSLIVSQLIAKNVSRNVDGSGQLFFNLLSRQSSFGEEFFEVTKLDPHPISDLGLRRSEEARLFFEGHASHILSTNLELKDFIFTLDQHDFASLSLARRLTESDFGVPSYDFEQLFPDVSHTIPFLQRLMYYVNVLGSWEDALSMARVVGARAHWLSRGNLSAYLLTCSGNIYAIHRDPRCREFYALADCLYEDTSQRFFNAFRSVVAELKRVGTDESTRLAFEEIRSHLVSWVGMSQPTRVFCKGVVDNLEALFHLRKKDYSQARLLINSALNNMKSVSNDDIGLDLDVINRYRVQVLENDALLDAHEGNWSVGVHKMKRVVNFVHGHHHDSRGEATSFLGYLLYRAGNYEEAYDILLEAERLVGLEPRPSALLQLRRLLQGCSLRMNRDDDAARWAANSRSLFDKRDHMDLRPIT